RRARCRAAARACPTCCGARRGCPPPARSLGVADRPRGPARQRLRRGAAGRAVPGDAGLRAGRPGCAGLPDLLPAGQESRSVSVLLGFLLLERGVGVDEGLDLVRSSRPQVTSPEPRRPTTFRRGKRHARPSAHARSEHHRLEHTTPSEVWGRRLRALPAAPAARGRRRAPGAGRGGGRWLLPARWPRGGGRDTGSFSTECP
ncbi:unnamed protein product, partial [Prorocentrum cordatum]